MKNIILIAPPAAGKGVQSKILKETYNLLHLSTGALLREEVEKKTKLGRELKEFLEKGILVKDEIVIDLVMKKLDLSLNNKGYILDGFPRTLKQAELYDRMSSERNCQPNYVFFLNITKEIALKRILGRLGCLNCGSIFNEEIDHLTEKDLCPNCQGKIIKRSDDQEESFNKRYDDYLEKTKPVIQYYQNKGILYIIDAKKSITEISKQIKEILAKDLKI